MNQYILVIGNLSDGFGFVGPFVSFDEADEYSRDIDETTWISTLTPPIPFPEEEEK